MLTRKKVQTSIYLVIAIIILANIIFNRFYFRLDFTADQRYSLDNSTLNILENLSNPVTITAYFSENLPPDIEKVKTDFKDLLIEYSNYSDGLVVYQFVNPTEDQETEMKVNQSGISPLMINVREKDQLKQQKAYLGVLIEMGEKKDIIPVIQPGAAMEYALSTGIKKISISSKPKIALLQGQGEPSPAQLQQLIGSLNILYEVQPITLSDTATIPSDISSILIIAPKDSMEERYFSYLDNFLKRGGNILAAINTVEGDFQTGSGKEVKTNFPEWLKRNGLEIESNFVIDVNCSNVMVQQKQGMFVMNTPVKFPYIPIVTNFADHAITKGLETVGFQFVSSVKYNPSDTTSKYYPLAVSSDKAGIVSLPLVFNVQKQWTDSDFGMSSVPVALAVEKGVSAGNSRIVVFGDGDFVITGEGQKQQRLNPDNINLMSNAVDWLSDDTGLINLRTKGITSRPIDATLDDSTKAILKYFNFLAPILLIIFYGVFRFQFKRKFKTKLMQINYVQR